MRQVKGGGGQFFFSLAKGNMRQLDWLGASSSKTFTILCSAEVEQFVKFDVTECNLLVLGNLILKQGRKGVPIGGFLSAQLAELWALWREHENLSGYSCDQTTTLVNEQVKANSPDESTNNLLPPLPFWPPLFLTGDSDFTLGSSESQHMNYMIGIVRSPNIAQVTPEALNNEGFEGWWNPVKKSWAKSTLAEVGVYSSHIPYLGMVPGEVGLILSFAIQTGKTRSCTLEARR